MLQSRMYLAAFAGHSAKMNSISDVLADYTKQLTFRYFHFCWPHCTNKKFELMLTRRAKAYGSSGSVY